MTTHRRMRFLRWQLVWMLGTVLALVVLGAFTYELYFVLSLIGLLVVTELTAPIAVTPTWRRRLRWVILVGLVGFGGIVVRRILEILPPEVMPW